MSSQLSEFQNATVGMVVGVVEVCVDRIWSIFFLSSTVLSSSSLPHTLDLGPDFAAFQLCQKYGSAEPAH